MHQKQEKTTKKKKKTQKKFDELNFFIHSNGITNYLLMLMMIVIIIYIDLTAALAMAGCAHCEDTRVSCSSSF